MRQKRSIKKLFFRTVGEHRTVAVEGEVDADVVPVLQDGLPHGLGLRLRIPRRSLYNNKNLLNRI